MGDPAGVLVVVLWHLRPRPVAWLFLFFVAWWPPTTVKVWTGNPVIWTAAALWIATVWRPAAVAVLLKPTLLPFAFFGANRRSWWVALAAVAFAAVLFAPRWPDYIGAILNARDPGGLLYSVQEVPILAAPLVAWALSGERALARRTQRDSDPAA